MSATLKLLFICTHNACRSILSEAITRAIAGERIHVASAGSSPAKNVHPLTLEYLSKYGYSTDGLYSKTIDEVRPFEPDVVVTVCDNAARESCPVWLGDTIKVHWGLPDPSKNNVEDRAEAFANVISVIESRTRCLLDQSFDTSNADHLKAVLESIGDHTNGNI